jgi:hypothetical protein
VKSQSKGRRHGAAMMIGMFFANLFDPKKGIAIEQIATQRRIGSETNRIAQAAAARPSRGARP